MVGVFALIAITAVAPPTPSLQMTLGAKDRLDVHGQSLTVSGHAAVTGVTRDAYSATSGIQELAADGTNYDWAELVLSSAGWPTSDNNVTVLVRWMRQENGPPDWWNRNNPLNNGLGSGGGGGTGTYANLEVAAQKAAENLQRPAFRTIAVALGESAPTGVTEQAIWASPWSTSHYGNGTHWSYTPVPTVKAPAGAW